MEQTKPIFVFNMTRHGIRSPCILNNQIDLLGYEWKEKAGLLTENGRIQQEALGKKLRSQYGHLISENIKTYSTNFSRTKNSLKANLRGLLDDEQLEKQIFKQAVIIPSFDTVWEVYHFKKLKKMFGKEPSEEFKEYFEKFKTNSAKHYNKWLPDGYDKDDAEVLEAASNNLACLIAENRNTARFENIDERKRESEEMFVMFYRYCYCTKAKEVQDLNNTALFKAIFDHFEKSKEGEAKYVAFSCHDISLLVVMIYLNRFFSSPVVYPPFASTLVFEMYESGKVKVVLNDEELLEVDYAELKQMADSTYVTYEEIVGKA